MLDVVLADYKRVKGKSFILDLEQVIEVFMQFPHHPVHSLHAHAFGFVARSLPA
jgi:hypothetical protein